MNINAKKLLIILTLTFLGIGLFKVSPVSAQTALDVDFEDTPLFDEANFLPGQDVTRWIKVTNNSGGSRGIAIEAINQADPDGFASQLNLTIKEGATILYSNTLAHFFSHGEYYLSDLNNGATTQYDLTIVFNSGSGNEYQEKRVGFDILIGFQGTEGQGNGGTIEGFSSGGGSGGGGALPQGLTISSTNEINITGCLSCSATIVWTTSYLSTSEVVYSPSYEPHTFDLDAPKYGYFYSSGEKDDTGLLKVTAHTVTLTNLEPNTTYYYRAVSHASPPTISTEGSFVTFVSESCNQNQIEGGNETNQGGETQGPIEPIITEGGEVTGGTEGTGGGTGNNQQGGQGNGTIQGQGGEEQVILGGGITSLGEEEFSNFLSNGLASIIDALRKIWGERSYLYLVFIFLVLFLLWFLLLLLKRKKQKEEEDKNNQSGY